MKKKRICLVIPSLQVGGMERVMSELANYFADRQHIDLHIILYGIKRDIFYSLPDKITIHKPKFEFNNRHRLFNSIRTFIFLRRRIGSLKPDAILSFGEYWNSFILLSIIGKKVPIFVSDRCQPNKNIGRIHEFLRKRMYPKSTGIIAQTAIAKTNYQKNIHHSNIKVIGNPVRMWPKENDLIRKNIVLTVGRLIKTKHHDELIKLFLKVKRLDWKLVIVGDDALKQNNKQKLQNLIKELDAFDHIILAGEQSDVESYYQSSKIFAFTSSSEGFPNVIGEALSFGLPVIGFDCIAGPADLIEDGKNGFLIPLFDYSLFGQKLGQLMDDENLRTEMGKVGKKSIEKYSIERIGSEYEDFLIGPVQ